MDPPIVEPRGESPNRPEAMGSSSGGGGIRGLSPVSVGTEPESEEGVVLSPVPSRSLRGGKGAVSFARGTKGGEEREPGKEGEEGASGEKGGEDSAGRAGSRSSSPPISLIDGVGRGDGDDGGEDLGSSKAAFSSSPTASGKMMTSPPLSPQVGLDRRPSLAASFAARLSLELPSSPKTADSAKGGATRQSASEQASKLAAHGDVSNSTGAHLLTRAEASFGSSASFAGGGSRGVIDPSLHSTSPSAGGGGVGPAIIAAADLPPDFELFSRRPRVLVLDSPSESIALDPDKLHEQRQYIEVRG